jgi:hypothetical protein
VPVLHHVGGAGLVAALVACCPHCMIAYAVQLGDLRVAVHAIGSPTISRAPNTSGCGRSRKRRRPLGTTEWPADIPVPQASIEFEVPDVAAAAKELNSKGYQLIHDARTEPWRQIIARLLSPEGLLVAVCYTPSFHDGAEP